MDIKSGCGYPGSALSNFAPHPFVIDGIECASMEGFLQSLKFKEPSMQIEVCKLVGRQAKFKGKKKKWFKDQTLYWQGVAYPRKSVEYQELLDRAFIALSHNEGFKRALVATRKSVLQHSIGKTNKASTILTASEFCRRLNVIRCVFQEEERHRLHDTR